MPANVKLIPYSIDRFKAEAYKALGFDVAIESSYKLCDFKPAYGPIFSAFNESLEYANRYFIAIYLERSKVAAWQLYSDWFEKGKTLQEAFFRDLQLDMTNPAIEVEFQKHDSWKDKSQLRATPTIIVNGYKLPENYKIEDLRYFTEFDVNIK